MTFLFVYVNIYIYLMNYEQYIINHFCNINIHFVLMLCYVCIAACEHLFELALFLVWLMRSMSQHNDIKSTGYCILIKVRKILTTMCTVLYIATNSPVKQNQFKLKVHYIIYN